MKRKYNKQKKTEEKEEKEQEDENDEQKQKYLRNKSGLSKKKKLYKFIIELVDENNIDDTWLNCVDGHSGCYGTSVVESLNRFQQVLNLFLKKGLEILKIVTRYLNIRKNVTSLSKRFKYNYLAKKNSVGVSMLANEYAVKAKDILKNIFRFLFVL